LKKLKVKKNTEKNINETKDKIIIFATEKQTLDLINDILIENKIKFVNLSPLVTF
jgi:hypothetical protein